MPNDVIYQENNIQWAPQPNAVSLIRINILPENDIVTSAYAFAFDREGRVLLADLDRGWDVPGGHREDGESVEEVAVRETLEETGVEIDGLELYLAQKVDVTAEKPENYPYPYPVSYQVFYHANVKRVGAFIEDDDSRGCDFFTHDQIVQDKVLSGALLNCYQAAYDLKK